MKVRALAVLAVAGLLSACGTAPREFRPVLASTPADDASFQATLAECRRLVAQGKRSGFTGRAASAGAGAAAGYATGAALFAGTGGSLAATAGAASLAVVAMPVVGVVAAIGVSRSIRAGKEKEINGATATCLQEHGHPVTGWNLQKRERKAAPGGPQKPS